MRGPTLGGPGGFVSGQGGFESPRPGASTSPGFNKSFEAEIGYKPPTEAPWEGEGIYQRRQGGLARQVGGSLANLGTMADRGNMARAMSMAGCPLPWFPDGHGQQAMASRPWPAGHGQQAMASRPWCKNLTERRWRTSSS